jgi:hypothetical protein
MSRIFGPIRLFAYVVKDIDKALDHWIKVAGIGPWFYEERVPITEFRYDGKPHSDFHVSVALANSGDLQIKLIQQRSRTSSMFTEFLAEGREGLHHWAVWPDDYDEMYQRAITSGYRIGHEGRTSRGRFACLRVSDHSAEGIEISELTGDNNRLRRIIRSSATIWDGNNPIRRM